MPIDLNKVLEAIDNETLEILPNGRKKRKKLKNGRYRYTKAGKLVNAAASNKMGFNFKNIPDNKSGVHKKKPKK